MLGSISIREYEYESGSECTLKGDAGREGDGRRRVKVSSMGRWGVEKCLRNDLCMGNIIM